MTEIRFEGRVAIVTGAGSALGAATPSCSPVAGRWWWFTTPMPLRPSRVAEARSKSQRRRRRSPNSDVVDTPEGAQAAVEAAVNSLGGSTSFFSKPARPSDAASSKALLTDTEPGRAAGRAFSGATG